MDIESSSEVAMLSRSLQNQQMASSVITKTLDGMNGTQSAPQAGGSEDLQKAVLSAAYADAGKGTKIDVEA